MREPNWRDLKCVGGHDRCAGGPFDDCPYCEDALTIDGVTNFEKVGAFHEKFGLPTCDQKVAHLVQPLEFLMRLDLIGEEKHELLKAYREGNVVKVADALADLLWVAYGTAHCFGIPIDEVFAEVARANMQKERSTSDDDPRSQRKSGLDVVKPNGWRPPEVAGVLFQDGVEKMERAPEVMAAPDDEKIVLFESYKKALDEEAGR